MATFADRLKELRKEKRITQEKLAERFFITKSAISKWENEVNTPENKLLQEMADFFDVSVDYLLGRSDERNKKESLFSGGESLSKVLNEIVKSGKEEEFLRVYEVFKKLQYHELEGDAADIVLENAADSYKKIVKNIKK